MPLLNRNNYPHCKTCVYWDRTRNAEVEGYRYCLYPDAVRPPRMDGFTGGDGGEPYNAGSLATGPDFGCIHHEEAKDATA